KRALCGGRDGRRRQLWRRGLRAHRREYLPGDSCARSKCQSESRHYGKRGPLMSNLLFKEGQPRIDRLQSLTVCALMVLGTAFVYSATMVHESSGAASWYNQIWVRQIIWYAIGIAAALGICLVDYHTLARWAMLAYWATILLLCLVLFLGTV